MQPPNRPGGETYGRGNDTDNDALRDYPKIGSATLRGHDQPSFETISFNRNSRARQYAADGYPSRPESARGNSQTSRCSCLHSLYQEKSSPPGVACL